MPRGLYDGPVHEVMLPAKPGSGTQARASCPGKISVPPVRNLHQSGFSLSGELSVGVGKEALLLGPAWAQRALSSAGDLGMCIHRADPRGGPVDSQCGHCRVGGPDLDEGPCFRPYGGQ